MSFGQNLQFLRKSKNMTQEGLAESLNVSRQSVSKWESDISFPEMDKLLQMCDMFSCSMDTLVKGSIETEMADNAEDYDKHMNSFAKSIASGIFTIISGVSIAGFLNGLSVKDGIAGMVFMTFVLISVLIFVVSGINHESFRKNNPTVRFAYQAEQIKAFERKFPVFIAVGIGVILFGLIITIGIDDLILNDRETGLAAAFENSVFLFCVSVGVSLMSYAGIQKDKYDVEKYNRENSPEEKKRIENSPYQKCADDDLKELLTEKKRIENSPYQKWYGIIMLVAAIIFMVTGFVWNLWHINWLVFPVGGLLCGIVSIIESSNRK